MAIAQTCLATTYQSRFKGGIMTDIERQTLRDFTKSVIEKCDKFIMKVEAGRARSRETYADLKELKGYAEEMNGTVLD